MYTLFCHNTSFFKANITFVSIIFFFIEAGSNHELNTRKTFVNIICMSAQTLEPFVCGGASACLASTIIHPIDLAKVRLQLFATLNPGVQKPAFTTIIANLVRNEGVFSMYAGLSASLLRQAVYGTARIGLHRTFSNMLVERNNGAPLGFGSKVLCGMASGSIAVCIGTPFDVALVRMQADSMKAASQRRGYKNVFDAVSRVAKEEGFSKLYRYVCVVYFYNPRCILSLNTEILYQ